MIWYSINLNRITEEQVWSRNEEVTWIADSIWSSEMVILPPVKSIKKPSKTVWLHLSRMFANDKQENNV